MPENKDFYTLLGIPRSATAEEIRRAYREAALRLHPDRNTRPGDTELFLEVSKAYEILTDENRRKEYDETLVAREEELAASSPFSCAVQQSRGSLLQLDEPQVHYLFLDITPSQDLPEIRPPINTCIAIDRSTSMRGQRLDQVRSATLSILKGLGPADSASIVAFSDRAEVIVSPAQAKDMSTARARLSLLQAGGGTEIGQGMESGLAELQRNFTREGVNHLILLTDGRTYGDEERCLQIADEAATVGITINGVGIGADWSDRLLDDLASRTGGSVIFLDSPRSITELLQHIIAGLTSVVASRVRLEGTVSNQVDLRSAFRLLPEPMPLGDSLPMMLGNLQKGGQIRIVLELVVHPIGQIQDVTLIHCNITGDLLGPSAEAVNLPVAIHCPVTNQPDLEPPPKDILSALSLIALYRMQEKARHEAELGQSSRAAKRLESLATQLLAGGEKELAKAALAEAEHLTHNRRLSQEGEKVLKYGTRALLLLPAKTEGT